MPLKEVNKPPTYIVPSVCKVMLNTVSSAPSPGWKVASTRPLELRRAKRLKARLSTRVNSPPSNTWPFGCTATARTTPFAPSSGAKDVSKVPSEFIRAMPPRSWPPTEVNAPPITMGTFVLPLGARAIA